MDFLMSLISTPLGWIMYYCYEFLGNYGYALILFTIITKLVMLPMSIKQQKGLVKMAAMRPYMEELQAKYKGDPKTLNEEMSLLYQREKYNPLSGCLPVLIQFPILFGLIDVVYYPLKHILRMPQDIIDKASEIVATLVNVENARSPEMLIIREVQTNPAAFASIGEDFVAQIEQFDFTFLGIYLGDTPTFAFNLLMLVPILSVLTSGLMMYITTKKSTANMGANNPANSMTKSMLFTMPLMSGYISFVVPAGVGFYWVFSNIFAAVQTLILYKIYNPQEMIAKAKAESEERIKKEREERIEAKKKLKEGKKEYAEKAMTNKEMNSSKISAARKRMAEKYGDTYKED